MCFSARAVSARTYNLNRFHLLVTLSEQEGVCRCLARSRSLIVLFMVINNGVRMRLAKPPKAPFHVDSNELLFVSIALKLTEILVDCDLTCSDHPRVLISDLSTTISTDPSEPRMYQFEHGELFVGLSVESTRQELPAVGPGDRRYLPA
jgi:hypothetical protein